MQGIFMAIFGDVKKDAPMLWWADKYALVSKGLRNDSDGSAVFDGKVWLNQTIIVTARRWESLDILDMNLSFARYKILELTGIIKLDKHNLWFGAKFAEGDWFKVYYNRILKRPAFTDMSNRAIELDAQQLLQIESALDVFLARKK